MANGRVADELLARIDSVVTDWQQALCGCGCGTVLLPDGASFYFAGPGCQQSFTQQQALRLAGDSEAADEIRRARRDLLVRERAEQAQKERLRQERDRRDLVFLRVRSWLAANGLDPDNIVAGRLIVTSRAEVTVSECIRADDGRIILLPGEVPAVQRTVPLVVPWPEDLEYEHHLHAGELADAARETAEILGDPDTMRAIEEGAREVEPWLPGNVWAAAVDPTLNPLPPPAHAHFHVSLGQLRAIDFQPPLLTRHQVEMFHQLARRIDAVGQAWAQGMQRAFAPLFEALRSPGTLPAQQEQEDVMRRAIEAKRNRNTGPKPKQRTPRRIDPTRSR